MKAKVCLGLCAIVAILVAASPLAFEPSAPVAVAAGVARTAQASLPAEVASYTIEANLASDGTTVHGSESIRYRNPSADVLSELYLHLYLNAFRSADTTWMREAGQSHRGFAFDPAAAGSVEVESVAVGGERAELELDTDGTIARLPLPKPLGPGEQIQLHIAWTSRLPRVFARTGWAPGGFTMVAQWYPKLAVYDPRHGGWDREPWHANAEFFHDFGNYELALTVPTARSTVVANGEPVGEGKDNGDGTATWHFQAQGVTDAVWMAAEHFSLQTRALGNMVVAVALPADRADDAGRYFDLAGYVLPRYEEWLGPYPWPRVTVVLPPANGEGAGGMEYPSLVTSLLAPAGWPAGYREPEVTTAHELAHQWFPMQVATNEARDPWLDEAFADYLTQRVMAERYGEDRSLIDLPFVHVGYLAMLRAGLATAARTAITKPAWEYSTGRYGAAVYGKGSVFLTTLERVFGTAAFTAALQDYVTQWGWRHPNANDFGDVLSQRLGQGANGDEDVRAWLDQIAFGERVLDVAVNSVSPNEAVVQRTGDATLPASGVTVMASGRTAPWRLGADATTLEVAPPAGERIAAVIADPQHALVVEPKRIDDGLTTAPQEAMLIGVQARLVEVIAMLLQVVGLFG